MPSHWSYVLELGDKHEFYQNNEEIVKPKDSWQTLVSLHYVDGNFSRVKDCIFFKVPGSSDGILKLKTISINQKCEDALFDGGYKELTEIKNLQFSILENELNIDFTKKDFKSEKWKIPLKKSLKKSPLNNSSAEYKASKIIYLAPEVSGPVKKSPLLKEGENCHKINDDCETSSSRCNECPQGWYEIPNGCPEGPKYCGYLACGKKNGPACRRGIVWQKKEQDFDCRVDTSFAYCSKGLFVQCEGRKAFCR